MRKNRIVSLMLLLLFVATDSAMAEKQSSTKKYHSQHGTIASVDPIAQTLTVMHGADASTFKIDSSTKYRATNKEIGFSDLKVGDDVRVSFTEENGEKVAARVDVAGKKGGTDDPGPACKSGYHRCGHDCCKD